MWGLERNQNAHAVSVQCHLNSWQETINQKNNHTQHNPFSFYEVTHNCNLGRVFLVVLQHGHHDVGKTDSTFRVTVSGLYSVCLSITSHHLHFLLTFLWKWVGPLLVSQIKRSTRSFHPADRKQLKTKCLQSLTCTRRDARHSKVQMDKKGTNNIERKTPQGKVKRKKLRLRKKCPDSETRHLLYSFTSLRLSTRDDILRKR